MNIKLLRLIILFIVSTTSYAQFSEDKLVFNYDTAGNQIKRYRVCLNCPSESVTTTQKQSETSVTKKPLRENESSKVRQIIAYPNPTTNLLQLEWINTSAEFITELNLFTLEGKLLFQKKVPANYREYTLDFSNYPIQTYIVRALYNTGKQEVFKVIKE